MTDLTDRTLGFSSSLAIKAPVRVATTANITLSGMQSIDGVTPLSTEDPILRRVLVKNQTDAAFNGVYVMDTGPWSRALDFNASNDFARGTRIYVWAGTSQAGTWITSSSITPSTFVIDEDDISFTLEVEGSTRVFATEAAAQAAAVGSGVGFIQTLSFADNTLGGGASYRRSATQPSHDFYFQSADGAYWELTSRLLSPPDVPINILHYIPRSLHAAIKANTSTTNVSSYFRTAFAAVGATRKIYCPAGTYVFTSNIPFITSTATTFAPGIEIIGDGPGKTIFDNRCDATDYTNTFATTNLSAVVTVTRTAHGKSVGQQETFFGTAGTIGSLTFDGTWMISSVPTADTFTFVHTTAASSTASGSVTYAVVNPLFDLDSDTELEYQMFAKVSGISVISTTAPTGSTAFRVRRVYQLELEHVWIKDQAKDGIHFTCPNHTAGDRDGPNMVSLKHVRIDDCTFWGINSEIRSGNNEFSFLKLDQVFVQGCGSAAHAGINPPISGGIKWKGQVINGRNVACAVNENIGLFIVGAAGLANTAIFDGLAIENNVDRGVLITGLGSGKFRGIQLYANDASLAESLFEIDGGSFVSRNIEVDGVVVRATSANNAVSAFKISGANADVDTCLVKADSVSWENFDYTGQVRYNEFLTAPTAGPQVNALMNGAFEIWQRGAGSTNSTAGAKTLLADGWYVNPTGATVVQIRTTSVPSGSRARYGLQVTGAASVTTCLIGQKIASWDMPSIRRTVTFSAQIRNGSGAAFAPNLLLGTPGAENDFTTVTNRLTQALQSCADAAWTRVSFTVDISAYTNIANGLQVEIQIPSGSLDSGSKTVIVTEAMLAPTRGPTPFYREARKDELDRCLLRYTKTFNYATAPAQGAGLNGALTTASNGTAAGAAAIHWKFQVGGTPTITTFNPSTSNANWRNIASSIDVTVAVSEASDTGVRLTLNSTMTDSQQHSIHASAEWEP